MINFRYQVMAEVFYLMGIFATIFPSMHLLAGGIGYSRRKIKRNKLMKME